MRYFNTSGPCDPERHYTLLRPALLAKGQRLVEQGRYFTLFAPRQSGKTTYFQLLFRQLQSQGYLPIWISFESLKTATRAQFYEALHWNLNYEFTQAGLQVDQPITNQIPCAPGAIDTTPRFQLPADLRQRLQPPLAAQFAGTARPRRPITPVPAQPPPLLHDLAQWLIYLHQEQELVLQSR